MQNVWLGVFLYFYTLSVTERILRRFREWSAFGADRNTGSSWLAATAGQWCTAEAVFVWFLPGILVPLRLHRPSCAVSWHVKLIRKLFLVHPRGASHLGCFSNSAISFDGLASLRSVSPEGADADVRCCRFAGQRGPCRGNRLLTGCLDADCVPIDMWIRQLDVRLVSLCLGGPMAVAETKSLF